MTEQNLIKQIKKITIYINTNTSKIDFIKEQFD